MDRLKQKFGAAVWVFCNPTDVLEGGSYAKLAVDRVFSPAAAAEFATQNPHLNAFRAESRETIGAITPAVIESAISTFGELMEQDVASADQFHADFAHVMASKKLDSLGELRVFKGRLRTTMAGMEARYALGALNRLGIMIDDESVTSRLGEQLNSYMVAREDMETAFDLAAQFKRPLCLREAQRVGNNLSEAPTFDEIAEHAYLKVGHDPLDFKDFTYDLKGYIVNHSAEALREILSNLDNKVSREIFMKYTGNPLGKSVSATLAAVDQYCGISATERAQRIEDKKAGLRLELLKTNLESAWARLESLPVQTLDNTIIKGSEFIVQSYEKGHVAIMWSSRGAAKQYLLGKDVEGVYQTCGLTSPCFNSFCRHAHSFGGLNKALLHLKAIQPVKAEKPEPARRPRTSPMPAPSPFSC